MFFDTHISFRVIYLDDDIRNTKLGISVSKSSAADLKMIQNDRLKFLHNPLIAYLNINSFRNKIIDLGEILKELPLDYLVISETKLDESFPNAQFKLNGYDVRARRDRQRHGGGLIEFVRQGFICKRLKKYELNCSECICSEFTISKKKWICFSIYRLPSTENIKTFFEEMNEVSSKALCKYENLIVTGDFNMDIKSSNSDKGKLENFCNPFNLTNLVHSETYFMKSSKSIIDLILTSKPLHFQKTHVVETGLSENHKMSSTFFKACSSKLRTKVIYYRSYKKFNESDFLCSLKKANFNFSKNDPNQNYNLLTDKFLVIVNKHAPLKKKFVRGNNAPFMNREFQKEIHVRSRLRNKYWVEPSAENKAAYKKQRNKCVKIRRTSIIRYMYKTSEKGIETNKSFWNFIKPFMTNKGMIASNVITLIEGKNVITDEYEISQTFNRHYINIVEKSCGSKPNKIGTIFKLQ